MSKEIRERLRRNREHIRKENKKWPAQLVDVPESQWPKYLELPPTRLMRSSGFLCQIFAEGNITRLTLSRTSIDDDGNYMADISWEELQRLKREAGFGIFDAVEIFPADADVVNVACMRHLWITGEKIPYAWRKKV